MSIKIHLLSVLTALSPSPKSPSEKRTVQARKVIAKDQLQVERSKAVHALNTVLKPPWLLTRKKKKHQTTTHRKIFPI